MRLGRKTLGCLLLMGLASSLALASFEKAFKAMPEDTVAVISLNSLAEADSKFNDLIEKLEMGEMLPPDQRSLVKLLTEKMKPGDQFDANGSMAIVVLEPSNIMMIWDYFMILAPTKNGEKMLEDMDGTKYPTGVWEVVREGEAAYALPMGTHVGFSPSQELMETLAERESKKSLADQMSPQAMKALDGLDLVVWMNADKLISISRGQIDALLPMLAMAADPNDPFAQTNIKSTTKMIKMLLDGAAGFSFGLGLHDDGVPMRMMFYAKPDTELARRMEMGTNVKGAANLSNLADGDFVVAFSALTNKEAMITGFQDTVMPYVEAARTMEDLDQDQLKKTEDALRAIWTSATAFRGVIQVLPEDATGVFGASLILDVTDSAGFCSAWGEFIDGTKGIVDSLSEGSITEMLEPLVFAADAGKVGDIAYHTLSFDLEATGEFEEEDLEDVEAILGSDGLSFRVLPVTGERVLICFGGGDAYAKLAVKAATSEDAPLAKDAGIKAAMKRLPEGSQNMGFLAADRLLTLINRGALAIDEDPLPVEVPKLKEPLSTGSVAGKTWSRTDMFIPMDFIVAVKDFSISFMGMDQQPEPVTPADEAAAE
jgi:hypothetical protein